MDDLRFKKRGLGGLVFNVIKNTLFPRFCIKCGVEGSLLCDLCFVEWDPQMNMMRCTVCNRVVNLGETCEKCLVNASVPDGRFSLFSYADPVFRQLVKMWKYQFDKSAMEILKRKIISRSLIVEGIVLAKGITTITPLPLHSFRERERGFDQSCILSEILSEEIKKPVSHLLERIRQTGKQVERSVSERRSEMMNNPFVVPDSLYIPKRVLLVDDVWTTGATAMAGVEALRLAGVEKVWVFTVGEG